VPFGPLDFIRCSRPSLLPRPAAKTARWGATLAAPVAIMTGFCRPSAYFCAGLSDFFPHLPAFAFAPMFLRAFRNVYFGIALPMAAIFQWASLHHTRN